MTNKAKNELYKKLPDVLIPWYRENARDLPWRKDREPYHVWLSEIMLQQTRVEAVKAYYIRFLKELPTIEDLAGVKEEVLLKLWEGLGYYNRARNLKKAAQTIVSKNNGVFPSEYSEILTLPGIGEYTAGAIASNCFDEPTAAVDGNVLRVVSRIMEDRDDILKASTKKRIKAELEEVYPKKDCGDFTQSLMELGATVCLPAGEPQCAICPAAGFCLARKHGTQMELPVKIKKKSTKVEERTVFILRRGDKLAIRKRPKSGLLADMWEFPNVLEKQTAARAIETAAQWGCRPVSIEKELHRNHIFSHVRWEMICFFLECEKEAEGFTWMDRDSIQKEIALPTAFRQFFE